MRILAIDYGTRRVGLAISDESATIASPLGYLPAQPTAKLIEEIKKIVKNKKVGLIIIGIPKNMDGSLGKAAQNTLEFIKCLQNQLHIPIKGLDERLTSVAAEKILIEADVSRKKRKDKIDALAATLLLQNFLETQMLGHG